MKLVTSINLICNSCTLEIEHCHKYKSYTSKTTKLGSQPGPELGLRCHFGQWVGRDPNCVEPGEQSPGASGIY